MSILKCLKGQISNKRYAELEDLHETLLRNANGNVAQADVALIAEVEEMANSLKKVDIMSAIKAGAIDEQIAGTLKAQIALHKGLSAASQWMSKTLKRDPMHHRAASEVYGSAQNAGTLHVKDAMEAMGLIYQNITAKGVRLAADHKTFAKVMDGMIDGADSVQDPAIRSMVKEMRGVIDDGLDKYRAQGGIVGKVDNYVPLRHSRQKMIDGGMDAWKTAYKEMNNLAKMRDYKTGKPMSVARFDEIADQMWLDITTNGASKAERELAGSGGKNSKYVAQDLFSRRMQHRLTIPKDSKAFRAYNELYGVGDEGMYDLMMTNIREMAHDTGVMSVMGPAPHNQSTLMIRKAEAAGASNLETERMEAMFRTLIGSWKGSADGLLTKSVANLQNLLSGSLLGGAAISAIGDRAMIASAKQLSGLMGIGKQGGFDTYLATMAGDPANIVRGIHMMEAMAHSHINRFLEGDVGAFAGKISQGINDFKNLNHRVGGLNRITLAGGDEMSVWFASALGEMVDGARKYADIPDDFRMIMTRKGMSEADWSTVLKQGTDEAGFITRGGFLKNNPDIGQKIGDIELELRAWATNSPELRTRMYSSGNIFGAQVRGGAGHMLASSLMQFKSFPLQVFRNHLTPAMIKMANGQVAPIFTLLAQGIVFGVAIVQLKELLKGNPPLQWDDPSLYARGLVQSGVGGIMGDIMFKDPEQYKRSIIAEMVGPVASVTGDTALQALTVAKTSIQGFIDGETDTDWKPFIRAGKSMVPFGTLWYLNAGIERGLMDALNTAIDPEYYENIQRREEKFQEERGQRSYYDQAVRQ
jgi:hypothetical protein